MAPEVRERGHKAWSELSEVFALGISIAECIFGSTPFEDRGLKDTSAIQKGPRFKCGAKVSSALRIVLERALAYKHTERMDAATLAAELERVAAGQRIESRWPWHRRALTIGRHHPRALLVAVVLLVLGAFAIHQMNGRAAAEQTLQREAEARARDKWRARELRFGALFERSARDRVTPGIEAAGRSAGRKWHAGRSGLACNVGSGSHSRAWTRLR